MAVDDPPAADTWVDQLRTVADREDNPLLGDVAECFQYLLDHRQDWEAGALDLGDLPAFTPGQQWLIKRSVLFGTCLLTARSTLHVVTTSAGRFVGVFGHEHNAHDRAQDGPRHLASDHQDNGGSLAVESVTAPGRDPQSCIDPLLDAPGSGPQAVGENHQAILDNADAFTNAQYRPDDLPRLASDTKWLIAYAVLFGMLWEGSYPGLYAILDLDDRFHGLYSTEQAATAAVDDYRDRYCQRVTIVDGSVGTDDLLDDPTLLEATR